MSVHLYNGDECPFQVGADRTRAYKKPKVSMSNTIITMSNHSEVVKASFCSKPGIDSQSKVAFPRYPSMKALTAELMKSSIFLLMDGISKGAMSRASSQSTDLLVI